MVRASHARWVAQDVVGYEPRVANDVVYGLRPSASSIGTMERRMAAALAAQVTEARDWVRQAPVVHSDENGWRQDKQRAWLRTEATDEVAVFNFHRRRSQVAATELLGAAFAGAVCTVRLGACNWVKKYGYGWAHLERDSHAMAKRCVRRAVIRRMKSFDPGSEHRSRFVEWILSAVTTLQFQQRDVFGYLGHARQAAVAGATPWFLGPGA